MVSQSLTPNRPCIYNKIKWALQRLPPHMNTADYYLQKNHNVTASFLLSHC